MQLTDSLHAWGTAGFADTLQRELARHADELPLERALTGTSSVTDDPITVMLLTAHADETALHVKVGIFFSGILAGCSCADDPTPVAPQPEYCELEIEIDRGSGQVNSLRPASVD